MPLERKRVYEEPMEDIWGFGAETVVADGDVTMFPPSIWRRARVAGPIAP